jgi:hypothetical protein
MKLENFKDKKLFKRLMNLPKNKKSKGKNSCNPSNMLLDIE